MFWCKVVGSAFATLLAVLVFRAEFYYARRPKRNRKRASVERAIKGDGPVSRLREALQIATITYGVGDYDRDQLTRFNQFLRDTFPGVFTHPTVHSEVVNHYSLLLHVTGSDAELKPYLLCAHMDVVPVESDKWEVDPFGGVLKDGYIYGRGALDMKDTLMAIMESLDYLLSTDFKPRRSFYIAFGHDEECHGLDGAAEIAKTLQNKGVTELEFLLDEGSMILRNSVPGIRENIAMVSVSEKGYLNVKLKAKGEVGHSSLAPRQTAINVLARAVAKFEGNVHPSFFGSGSDQRMYEEYARHATYPRRLLYANRWLFKSLLSRTLSARPSSNNRVRTTTAPTIIRGGIKDNVLPSEAEAIINHRVHPMQTLSEVLEFDRKLINDPRIEITTEGPASPAHPISPHGSDSFGYQIIKTTVEEMFDNTIVVPGFLGGSTDTKHYLNLTKSVYRFSPVLITLPELALYHGHNERISVENYLNVIHFFHQLMLKADQATLTH